MEGDEKVNEVLRSGLVALVVLALVIALGTFGLVKFLGLDSSEASGPNVEAPVAPVSPLPTTALPVPGESDTPTPSEPETSDEPGADGLQISISPVMVRPMERINITGTYAGMDGIELQVQRKQGGAWTDFPVTVSVRAGAFATYVMTSQTGDNKFRVLDPGAGKASNAISVTVQ